MNTIATVKFVGKNITRSGVATVESKKDVVVRAAHRSVTYTGTDDASENHLRQEDNSSQQEEAAIDLQTGAGDSQRNIDFPPFEGIQV